MKFLNKNLDKLDYDIGPDFYYVFDIHFDDQTYEFDVIHNADHYTNYNIVDDQIMGNGHIGFYQAEICRATHGNVVNAAVISEMAAYFKQEILYLHRLYKTCGLTHEILNEFENNLYRYIIDCYSEEDLYG